MDSARNQINRSRAQGRLIDFAPATHPDAPSNDQSDAPKRPRPAPTPVTSAKAAINAMYAARSREQEKTEHLSARDAVNAAASQTSAGSQKAASSLHHGSIQKNVESVRPSASAMLRVARKSPPKISRFRAMSSADPLVKLPTTPPKKTHRPTAENTPVVHTSLKLGNNARPKPAPVVLPPNARMAQIARPVQKVRAQAPLNQNRQGIVHRSTEKPRVTLRPNPSAKQVLEIREAELDPTTPAQTKPAPTNRGATQPMANRAGRATSAKEAIGRQMGQPQHFRSAPKGFATNTPQPMSVDSSYVMAEPPKLHPRSNVADQELGVAEDYRSSGGSESAGDHAPIGRIKEEQVASGHGGAAPIDLPGIKTENTSNYSFSRPKTEPEPTKKSAPKLGERSPFIKSVNVDKRPLSDNAAAPTPNRLAKPLEEKTTHKNLYPKKSNKKTEKKSHQRDVQSLPTRPTVIIPTGHRSKAPLFFLVVITIILGAAVGAAAYLCFFQ